MEFNQSYYLSISSKRQLRKLGATIENEKYVAFVSFVTLNYGDELAFTSWCKLQITTYFTVFTRG